jgi:hypothetical protein
MILVPNPLRNSTFHYHIVRSVITTQNERIINWCCNCCFFVWWCKIKFRSLLFTLSKLTPGIIKLLKSVSLIKTIISFSNPLEVLVLLLSLRSAESYNIIRMWEIKGVGVIGNPLYEVSPPRTKFRPASLRDYQLSSSSPWFKQGPQRPGNIIVTHRHLNHFCKQSPLLPWHIHFLKFR